MVQSEARVRNRSSAIDMRGVDGLGDALQKIPLTIDDALRPAGTAGRKHHAGGLVQVEFGGTPALSRGLRQTGQMDDARGRRDGLDAAKDILSSDDQSWPRILQHLAQPVAWILRIQGDKGASRRQARQHGERKHRTRRQDDADELPGLVSAAMVSASPERPSHNSA